jgi:hypothetical protein
MTRCGTMKFFLGFGILSNLFSIDSSLSFLLIFSLITPIISFVSNLLMFLCTKYIRKIDV